MKLSAAGKLTNVQEALDDYRKVQLLNDPSAPYSLVDPELKQAVALLNEQPGVMTTDCCASHHEEGKTKKQFYCAFFVTEEGLDFLADLVMTFTGFVSGNPHIDSLVSQIHLKHRLRLVAREFQHVGHVWTITVPSHTPITAAFLASCFTEAVEHVIKDRGAGSI
ncbi:hypothetical protein D3C73_209080 [compost metagenome]|jgi:hypothetical protein